MNFYPINTPVPERLQTDEFVIVPLTPAHVELDYAALMSSKKMLRLWSGSPWPTDDFTLDENLDDLQWHWDEHQKRIAFTFTVLNPTEDTCLGCVYIKPITEILASNKEWMQAISDHSALVRFWAAQPTLAQELDKTLLQALRQWFATDWVFTEIFWHTPIKNQQQINLFQTSGLQKMGLIPLPNRGGSHILFK